MNINNEYEYCQGLADSFMQGGERSFDFEEEFEEARENLAGLLMRARAQADAAGAERIRSSVLIELRRHADSDGVPVDAKDSLRLAVARIAKEGFGQ